MKEFDALIVDFEETMTPSLVRLSALRALGRGVKVTAEASKYILRFRVIVMEFVNGSRCRLSCLQSYLQCSRHLPMVERFDGLTDLREERFRVSGNALKSAPDVQETIHIR